MRDDRSPGGTQTWDPDRNEDRTLSQFEHDEQISRQQAAERLVDIAYALTGGAMLELRAHDERVEVPIADEVRLTRRSTSSGERVIVEIGLSWSGPRGADRMR
jgi:amphi-Trp domain-containing protein